MAPKKRKVEEEEVDLDDVSEDEEPVKKSPKPRKPKAPKAAWVDSTGWHAEPERFLLWK